MLLALLFIRGLGLRVRDGLGLRGGRPTLDPYVPGPLGITLLLKIYYFLGLLPRFLAAPAAFAALGFLRAFPAKFFSILSSRSVN